MTSIDPRAMTPWHVSDHPRLVFDLISLEREQNNYTVTPNAMANFLETYGPLSPSLRIDEGVPTEISPRIHLLTL